MKEHIYNRLTEQQEGKCAICERELLERYSTHIDRIVSGKDGGKYVVENCQLICAECDWEKEGNAPDAPYPELAAAYRCYKKWQTERQRYASMIRAATGDKAGMTKSPYIDGFTISEWIALRDYFETKEKEYEKMVKNMTKSIPACQLIMSAWGGGPILAAHIAHRFDIRKADTVSAMWKYFGYDPTEKYNPGKGKDLKSPLYASLSISLIRKNSPYRKFYDDYRAKEISHGGALLRIIKLWLSHLWNEWRIMEGLPVTVPYAINHLGHTGFISAEECGW